MRRSFMHWQQVKRHLADTTVAVPRLAFARKVENTGALVVKRGPWLAGQA